MSGEETIILFRATVRDALAKLNEEVPASGLPLAFQFFQIFARFEFAVKLIGCVRERKDQRGRSIPEPDWRKFSERPCLRGAFEGLAKKKVVRALLSDPPQVGIVRKDGDEWKLDWDSRLGEIYNLSGLLYAVCQVRNNLFHGYKTVNGAIIGSERNLKLLNAGLLVIDELLELDRELSQAFSNEA